MRIIDDKGRLFGKINIIDFFVLLFILCLMPVFYFGYKIVTKPKITEESQMIGLNKADYEKAQAEHERKLAESISQYNKMQATYKKTIAELRQTITEKDRKKNKFLKEFKGAGKYFE